MWPLRKDDTSDRVVAQEHEKERGPCGPSNCIVGGLVKFAVGGWGLCWVWVSFGGCSGEAEPGLGERGRLRGWGNKTLNPKS